MFAFAQEFRSTDVGRQHAFLDQPVRVVALVGFDTFDLAVVVENHARLDGLEIDGTALGALFRQLPVKQVQRFQMRQQRRETVRASASSLS
jgi:hypothetical protein